MNWIYILVVCLAIYYIAARYLEKHIDNFDPSLVPVSSIVTLAKVAQKLVDGGGTLTNPGNLTLGTAAAPGNLIVTGTSNLVGDTKVDGSLTVNGNKGIAINGTDGSTTKSPIKINNNNNTWLSVSQDAYNYLVFRNNDSKAKDGKDKNEKLAEIDCDTTISRGLRVANDLTVMSGQLRGNDGSRINWYDSGPTTIDTRNSIDFVTTPKQYYKSDPNWDGVVPPSTTMGGVDINGIYTFSPNNKKSAKFSSENNGDIALKDSTSTIRFSVSESGMAYSNGITTNSAQINGNLNVTSNLTNNAGLTYMPIIARGTITLADNGDTNGTGTNLVNCTVGGWGNGEVTITFITKPPNANYCFLATQNYMNMAVFRVDIAFKTTTSCRVNTNQTQSTGGAYINCDFIII